MKRKTKKDVDEDATLAFMRLLWAVDHELRSVSKRMEKSVGVTGPQRLVLLLLSQTTEPMAAGRLATELNIHPSTLTGVLTRLVAKKLLTCKSDPADARRTIIKLLPPGRKVVALRQDTVEDGVQKTLRRFSPKEIETAARVLRALASQLAAEPPGTGPQKRSVTRQRALPR